MHNISRSVSSQEAIANATFSMAARLDRLNLQRNPTTAADWDDPNASIGYISPVHHSIDVRFQIGTYTLKDISVLETINQYRINIRPHKNSAFATVTVQLQKAKRDEDGRIVLVKSYHDMKSTGQRKAVCSSFFGGSRPFLITP